MIYSVFDEHNGGFVYYDAGGPALNADHPTPVLRQQSPIGVASVDAARVLPAAARAVGRGGLPRGSIATSTAYRSSGFVASSAPDPSGLGYSGLSPYLDPVSLAFEVAVGAATFVMLQKAFTGHHTVKAAVSIVVAEVGGNRLHRWLTGQ